MPNHNSVTRNLRVIRTTFLRLAHSFELLGPMLHAAGAAREGRAPTTAASTRRRPRVSPAQRKALKLQGRYMGTMRGLKPRQRARVKRIREAKGVRAAIAAARRMAG